MSVPTPAAAMAIRDSLEEEVLIALVRAAWLAAERSNAVTAAAGLSPSQYNVLRILRAAGRRGLSCTEIGPRMGARFRSHAPDVRPRTRRIRCARDRCRRSPAQHQSDRGRGEGPAESSRSRRRRRREADPRPPRPDSTHGAPRPAGRLCTTTTTLGTHMTHRSRVSALLLPFALLAFIPKHPLEVVMSPAEQELRTLLTTYETSLNAGDAARIEQLYAEDGVFMPAGFPTASGRPAVRGAYDAGFANIRISIHFTVDELTVKGEVAYARTHSAGTATGLATGAKRAQAK